MLRIFDELKRAKASFDQQEKVINRKVSEHNERFNRLKYEFEQREKNRHITPKPMIHSK